MALQRVETDAIQDDAITTAKIAPNAVAAADIAADAITNVKVAAGAAIAVSKITGLGTAATLTAGTAANNVVQLDGSGRLPAVNGANLTGVSTDTSALENNIAILAFKTQSANNLAKFNLIDQVIDEYKDGTGATYSTAGYTGSTAADGYLSSTSVSGTSTSYGNTGGTGNRSSIITVTTDISMYAGTPAGWVDGNTSTNTSITNNTGVAGKYIRFQFSGAKKLINETKFYNQNNGAENAGTWKWQGSDNASSWTDISDNYVLSNNTTPEITTMSLSSVTNTNAYTYYQLYGVTGTADQETLSEMQFKIVDQTVTLNAAGTATSTANTALTAPTTGDICMLIENVSGTASLNTAGNDLRCAISRNGGTGWDYVTLVDKGSWGTNKKILTANNVAFSNSASGTDMRYKIEWANQASGTKVVRVHATSLAWA